MTQEEAGEHIQEIREYSGKLLAFVQPLLAPLTVENDSPWSLTVDEIAKAMSLFIIMKCKAERREAEQPKHSCRVPMPSVARPS